MPRPDLATESLFNGMMAFIILWGFYNIISSIVKFCRIKAQEKKTNS